MNQSCILRAKIWLPFVGMAGVTLLFVILLNRPWGVVPPLGKFLDPFGGFWQNAKPEDHPPTLKLEGIEGTVRVLLDERGVYHLFAENDRDLYFAQGYCTARDRLWQMEFQTHVAAGRLCEIVGPKALALDRFRRRIGMVYGAENSLETLASDAQTREIMQSYTAGVNAYIRPLATADYPLEYKILDYAPELWTPLKTALLLKYMAWELSWDDQEVKMTHTLARFGAQTVADLFPHYPRHTDPVIPSGTPWDFPALPRPKPTTPFAAREYELGGPRPEPFRGSNNWAVAGAKTQSGYPLLANDPHLSLSLPSIWYEIQLVSPTVNVYGISLPGAPCVIIGFNQQVAWGLTNADADVADWYEIRFRDASRKEYWHDNRWKPTRAVEEVIQVRGSKPVIEQVIYTHHGPVVLEEARSPFAKTVPLHCAFRWLAHDTSQELTTFWRLNRAKNYDDLVEAFSYYSCPAQNIVFADVHGDIALWHTGKLPLKWEGQGQFIGDGSDPLYDWPGWIPQEQQPHTKNPARGFVSSANQHPTDPTYPYYLNWLYASYERGTRINQRLAEMTNITPDDFRQLQNDTKNLHAASLLPTLLPQLQADPLALFLVMGLTRESSPAGTAGESNQKRRSPIEIEQLQPEVNALLQELQQWDFRNDPEKIAPTIWDAWWKELYSAIWADDFDGPLWYPSSARTAQMILETPQAQWFDDLRTPAKETLADLLPQSLATAYLKLRKRYGPLPGKALRLDGFSDPWSWGKHRGATIHHLARIPGLGRSNLFVGGASGIVNAITGTGGPSWRMIVSLGPQVRAWGIYPGGQSGNPGSPRYDNFIAAWAQGQLDELLFLQSQDQREKRLIATMDWVKR